jgi:hypothetical protein
MTKVVYILETFGGQVDLLSVSRKCHAHYVANSRECLLCADFQHLTTIHRPETEGSAVFSPLRRFPGRTPLGRVSDGRFGLRRFGAKPQSRLALTI